MVVCTLCPTVSGWRSQRQPTPPPPLPSFFPPTTGRTANTNYLIAICVTRNTSHKQVKTQNRIIQRLLVAVLDGCAGSAQGRWTQGGLGDAQPTHTGLNWTMVDHSYWIIRWIIQQMQSRLVIMYARAHTSRQWSFSDEAGPVMPPGEKIFYWGKYI